MLRRALQFRARTLHVSHSVAGAPPNTPKGLAFLCKPATTPDNHRRASTKFRKNPPLPIPKFASISNLTTAKMASAAPDPVAQPAKDLEMPDAQQEEPSTAPAAVNGGPDVAAAPSSGAEHTDEAQTTDTTTQVATVQQDQEEGEQQSGIPNADEEPKLSKNQLRKMKRKAAWEEGREDRKRKRKEKRHDRQAARREEVAAILAKAEADGLDPSEVVIPPRRKTPKQPSVQVPVSLIIDCAFEDYMFEKELISLASQVTRCYSDNRSALYRAHLSVSSYGGKLKDRFETTLGSQHVHWKGVRLVEGNFIEAAKEADELMKGPNGGEIIDLLKAAEEDGAAKKPAVALDVVPIGPQPDPEPAPADDLKDIVYLSSDSVNTLDRLEPGTSYVIGGLVDRNREKGLCHRRARELGVRTAKLPIGEYMSISSKRVLATNHVVEIMLKWLQTGDWAEAFVSVIPKRKEAKLKGEGEGEIEDSRFEEEDDEDVDEKQTITENVAAPKAEGAAQTESVKEETAS